MAVQTSFPGVKRGSQVKVHLLFLNQSVLLRARVAMVNPSREGHASDYLRLEIEGSSFWVMARRGLADQGQPVQVRFTPAQLRENIQLRVFLESLGLDIPLCA